MHLAMAQRGKMWPENSCWTRQGGWEVCWGRVQALAVCLQLGRCIWGVPQWLYPCPLLLSRVNVYVVFSVQAFGWNCSLCN